MSENYYVFAGSGRSNGIKLSCIKGKFKHDWDATGENPIDVAARIIRKDFPDIQFTKLTVRRPKPKKTN